MTDENPLLDEHERAAEARLRRAIEALGDHTGLADPYARFWRLGQLAGHSMKQIGANVAMAYHHGGSSFGQLMIPDGADKMRCSAAFYDGFSDAYWVDLTDRQKESPYA